MPSGDDWGAPPVGLNDNLMFGGRKAFRTDAQLWGFLRDNTALTSRPWIDEDLVRAALVAGGVVVERVGMAYCKIDADGACRYFGQLSRSLELLGDALLHLRPEVARLLCMSSTGPCNAGNTSGLTLQTAEDATRDPGWCRLLQRVERTSACPNGWEGKRWLAHRL